MPEVKMTEQELNDHVNGGTNHHPATWCKHTVPYGPATGKEDPRAGKTEEDKKPTPAPPAGAPPHNADQDAEHGPGVSL